LSEMVAKRVAGLVMVLTIAIPLCQYEAVDISIPAFLASFDAAVTYKQVRRPPSFPMYGRPLLPSPFMVDPSCLPYSHLSIPASPFLPIHASPFLPHSISLTTFTHICPALLPTGHSRQDCRLLL
jgi:hypothetical protein